jgi:hypothetical protein
MRKLILLFLMSVLPVGFSTAAVAGDFAWLNQLSVEAKADPAGFAARLSTRFHIGNAEVTAVIDQLGNQADAYMVMRLAEMSHHTVSYVSERYQARRHQGWGAFAKSLGIKPGSPEFHALKAGHDLDGMDANRRGKGKTHGHGNGKGQEKHKHKGKDEDD